MHEVGQRGSMNHLPHTSAKRKALPCPGWNKYACCLTSKTFYPPPILPFQAQTVPYGMAACYATVSTEEELQYLQQETSGWTRKLTDVT